MVAGRAQLDRPVRWVHVAEAADVGVMLSGGEMVPHHRGAALAGDEARQAEYIRSLHRAEAAAVVLGLGRAFPPPEVMRRAAERCGLPMVVLHRPFPFAELTEEVQSGWCGASTPRSACRRRYGPHSPG